MDMNSADVLKWLKSFINDENIIKVFEGNLYDLIFYSDNIHLYKHMYIIRDIINATCFRLLHFLIYKKKF